MKIINFKVIIVSVCCLFFSTIQASQGNSSFQKSKAITDITADEVEIVSRTNYKRKNKGIKPLKINLILMGVAREQASNMARKDRLSHSVNGRSFGDRIKASGYSFRHAGENIAESNRPVFGVVKLWMKSHGHRLNLLNPKFEEIGVGIATDENGDKYYAQVYGTPR